MSRRTKRKIGRGKRNRIILFIFLTFIFTSLTIKSGLVPKLFAKPLQNENKNNTSDDKSTSTNSEKIEKEERENKFKELIEKSALSINKKQIEIDRNLLNSKAVFIMDPETGEEIYSLEKDTVHFPASLTKIANAIVAIENEPPSENLYVMGEELVDRMIMDDASMAGFFAGETLCFNDLLYGTMLPSGGEAAVALSEMASGSEANHVNRMNELVEKLHLKQTHFANTSGLHDTANYTTAKEMAEIFRYSLKNPKFRELITASSYTTSNTEEHPEGIHLCYSLLNYQYENPIENAEFLGGKTGFTEEANFCLASLAKVLDKEYIIVTLDAKDNENTGHPHFDDQHYILNKLKEASLSD